MSAKAERGSFEPGSSLADFLRPLAHEVCQADKINGVGLRAVPQGARLRVMAQQLVLQQERFHGGIEAVKHLDHLGR